MYTLTRTKPDGTMQTSTHKSLRDCGKRMYFWMMDNGYADKAEATKNAQHLERTYQRTFNGNEWFISSDTHKEA